MKNVVNSSNGQEIKTQRNQKQNHSTSQNTNESGVNNYNTAKFKSNSMQDSFLNNCRHEKTEIEIKMLDRSIEKGIVVGFDNNTIIMENKESLQYLVMKNAISTIKPVKFVNYIFNDVYRVASNEDANNYIQSGILGN